MSRTPSQTVGPYYAIGLSRGVQNELVPRGEAGALELAGRLLDGRGDPISDGLIELWDDAGRRWGRCGTDREGRFSFVVAKPAGAHGAPHLEAYVHARGLLRHQWTRVYFPDEAEANAADPFLASLPEADRSTLVAGRDGDSLVFDIVMQGDRATVFLVH